MHHPPSPSRLVPLQLQPSTPQTLYKKNKGRCHGNHDFYYCIPLSTHTFLPPLLHTTAPPLIVACARIGAARRCCCRPYHDGLSRNSFFFSVTLYSAMPWLQQHTQHTLTNCCSCLACSCSAVLWLRESLDSRTALHLKPSTLSINLAYQLVWVPHRS